jgi:hypothetical protein
VSTDDDALNKSELGQVPKETVLTQDIQRTLTVHSNLIQRGLQPLDKRGARVTICSSDEISIDSSLTFRETSATLARKKKHSGLLSNRNSSTQGEGGVPAMGQLWRVRNNINRFMDASYLWPFAYSRFALRKVGGALARIVSSILGLNNIADNLRRKRSRDDYIVAGVIAMTLVW